MINAIHKIVPIPRKVKEEFANYYNLDSILLFVEEKASTAAEIAYTTTMLKSIIRQTGTHLPLDIAKFAITKDNLSQEEENRAVEYGKTLPIQKKAMEGETKEAGIGQNEETPHL